MELRLLLWALAAATLLGCCPADSDGNGRPVIGVVAQRASGDAPSALLQPGAQFVSGSVAAWVEAAGARTVAIPYNLPEPELRGLFLQLSGAVFPGGTLAADDLNSTYMKTEARIMQWAEQVNAAGGNFPIFGLCQGFINLMALRGGKVVADLDSEGLVLPLELTAEAGDSRLLGRAPAVTAALSKKPGWTINMHTGGITLESFQRTASGYWKALSTNRDRRGTTFVSTVESKDFPFWATQWHPEKTIFEWDHPDIEAFGDSRVHQRDAVRAVQHLANVFVDAAARSNHSFDSRAAELDAVLANRSAVFTAASPWHDHPDRTIVTHGPRCNTSAPASFAADPTPGWWKTSGQTVSPRPQAPLTVGACASLCLARPTCAAFHVWQPCEQATCYLHLGARVEFIAHSGAASFHRAVAGEGDGRLPSVHGRNNSQLMPVPPMHWQSWASCTHCISPPPPHPPPLPPLRCLRLTVTPADTAVLGRTRSTRATTAPTKPT
eukprot:COSAG01_NODE_4754_length_4764_cov_12.145123_3_plen_495_part_00